MTQKSTNPILLFTGGHHTGALEVAKILISRGVTVIWFGHRHSMWGDQSDSVEYEEVTAEEISFYNLSAGKFYRTFHPLKLIRLPWGFIQAGCILIGLKIKYGFRIKGIVSFGGYLAVPVTLCGHFLGLPVIVHEQTMVSGLANGLIARFAQKIAVSWPGGAGEFPPHKTVYTGSLIRPQIVAAADLVSLPSLRPSIYVTGGKQGSHQINLAVFSALPELLKTYTVVHQTGSSTLHRDFDRAVSLRASLPPAVRDSYLPAAYLSADQAAVNLSRSRVVVSRSGAHITAELAFLGTRSVLIPLPRSSHSEQEINARFLVSHHLAVLLPQNRLNPDNLISAIDRASQLHPQNIDLPHDGVKNLVKLITSQLL
jgi:UDP-N-acetylglucosamine--N-acetylmuramyl-(pentapeptide) pyrophosphoryl-undecaprenol N-acetylglucosamine transferase